VKAKKFFNLISVNHQNAVENECETFSYVVCEAISQNTKAAFGGIIYPNRGLEFGQTLLFQTNNYYIANEIRLF